MKYVNTSITAESVTGDTITFNDIPGYFVLTTDSETDTETTGNATATATVGDISNNTIRFGNGDGD